MSKSDKAAATPPAAAALPGILYCDVLAAVQNAPGLKSGVRQNMISAVHRCAQLQGNHGIQAVVNVPLIAQKFDRATPAQFGFKNAGSLAAFKSNVRRALRLANVPVMPGNARTPLMPEWQEIADDLRANDEFTWMGVSRFVHYLSDRNVAPEMVEPIDLERFELALGETCLKSKSDQVVRRTPKAWCKAQDLCPCWPSVSITREARKSDTPILPWEQLPEALRREIDAFVRRDDDWLDSADKKPLAPATQKNYSETLRRAASILVARGCPVSDLTSLASLTRLENVRTVLRHIAKTTGRRQGGHVSSAAVILYLAAKHSGAHTPETLRELHDYTKKTAARREMGARTHERLAAFGDERVLNDFLRLPELLMQKADDLGRIDLQSAKLARMALYGMLLIETCARSGNIAALDLERHIVRIDDGWRRVLICIPASEVKNNQPIEVELSDKAAAMLRHYVERYRPAHCATETSWLFPRKDGSHWTINQAGTDFKDLVRRFTGQDANPHLTRAIAGLVVLRDRPDALATVQQLLGHKSITTTQRFYIRLDEQRARSDYQSMLDSRRS